MEHVTADFLIMLAADPADPAAPAAVPSEIRLFKAGANATSKGTFQFSGKSALDVITAAADHGNDLPFDYDHAMLLPLSLDPAAAGAAAGWFRPEVRDGELWATGIRWTPRAAAMIANREYRYVSPAFRHSPKGEILKLINVALTNLPATKNQTPIMASQREQPIMDKEMLALLGLSEGASKESIAGALQALASTKAKVEQLNAEVEQFRKSAAKAEVDALVAAGQADGKIAPAMLDWAKGQTAETLRGFLAAAPKLVAPPVKEPAVPPAEKTTGGAPAVALTAEEQTIAEHLGIDPAKMLAHKVKIAGKRPVADVDED